MRDEKHWKGLVRPMVHIQAVGIKERNRVHIGKAVAAFFSGLLIEQIP